MVNYNYLNQFGGRFFRSLAFFGMSTVLVTLSVDEVSAQSVGITDGASSITPNPKSLLEIRLDNSATLGKGLLIPRVTHAQRVEMTTAPNSLNNAASSATESGMLVYQYESGTSPKGFYHWNGTSWARLLDATNGGWSTIGNSGTVAGTNFLGTTDNVGLRLRTNNTDRISIAASGNVGIGVSADALERLEVNGNLVLSEGADRRLYVAQTTSNVPGDDLTIEAGNAPNPAGSAQPGGHLVLQAGAGYSHTNPGAGGNVVIRSGGNSYGNSPSLADQWGDIVFQTGNNGSLLPNTRLTISKLGKVVINDLISAGPSVVTSSAAGQLTPLTAGVLDADKVLKVNGSGTGWELGEPALSLSALPDGDDEGDMLYWTGTAWQYLPVPTTPAVNCGTGAGQYCEGLSGAALTACQATCATVYYALTLDHSGGGVPSWEPTSEFTTIGDDMGDHTATTTLDMAGNRIEKASEVICSSDIRYKKNVEPIENALSSVLKMNGVTYDWRKEEFPSMGFGTNRQVGLIAQELEQVFPIVVNTDVNGYKSVNYAHMVALLIEAIKDQQAIIDGQREELTSLKGMKEELNTLKASVELLTEHIRTSQK
jgi:hypothetical protein